MGRIEEEDAVFCGTKGWVATIPSFGNDFFITISGGPCGAGFGCSRATTLVSCSFFTCNRCQNRCI